MVVFGIIAISAGIIIPVYNTMKPKLRLNGAVSQMQGDLMWARMQAISQNKDFRIKYDTPHHCPDAGSDPPCGNDYRCGDVDGDNDIDAFDTIMHHYTIWGDVDGDGVLDAGTETNNAIIKDLQTNYFDVFYSSSNANNLKFTPRGTASNWTTLTIKNPNPNYPDESHEPFGSETIKISSAGRIKAN